MENLFKKYKIGNLELENKFLFPPIKTGYGTPDGRVTDRHIRFYSQIAENGPGIIILEPVSVTSEGMEHPKQLTIHHDYSGNELEKIVNAIHEKNRLVCLHLNHAGAAANPKATGEKPKAPSLMTCPTTDMESEELSFDAIKAIIDGYKNGAEKAVKANFDLIEIQGGHGYLLSQFLNKKINKRNDKYGSDPFSFAKEVFNAVKQGSEKLPVILRISGNEMSPEYGVDPSQVLQLLKLAEDNGIKAVHVGMGSVCFTPPWYFHHGALPEKPQMDALVWVRENTSLPLIAAGRMGDRDRVQKIIKENIADIVSIGRPLIADPDIIEKWRKNQDEKIASCAYCLQGCLQRVKAGQPLGCNINPAISRPEILMSDDPKQVLIAGGGPAGMSAALYLTERGHKVTIAEKLDHLGGQFALAWQAPGKERMKKGLDWLQNAVNDKVESIILNKNVDADLVKEQKPDLLVWAVGAVQNIPEIKGIDKQNAITSIECLENPKMIKGKRVLIIGAGRTGIEIAEKLGQQEYEVVATKRTDPIGGTMEMITKKLAMMRLEKMKNVTIMPHTTVNFFADNGVEMEKDGKILLLKPFDTVILSSGMNSLQDPGKEISGITAHLEIIGDAKNVADIFSAVHAGYEMAMNY